MTSYQPLTQEKADPPTMVGGHVIFTWRVKTAYVYKCVGLHPLTEKEAQNIQGFEFHRPAAGYSFWEYRTTFNDGLYLTSWMSGSNCE